MDHLTIRKWLVTGVSEPKTIYHWDKFHELGTTPKKPWVINLRGPWEIPGEFPNGMGWAPPWRSSWRIAIAMTRGCPGKNQNINT